MLPAVHTLISSSWFFALLESSRDAMASNAEIIASAIAAVAAIVIMAKMVRFNYSLTSDDRGGGFGDIKAWAFIRPVLLLLCIELSPQIAGAVNELVSGTMNTLTMDISDSLAKTDALADKIIKENHSGADFIEAPVKYTRISSLFSLARTDPVDGKTVKPHNGIDYAAPIGTPVWAAGDGMVVAVGDAGNAGNRIRLQHDDNYETVYMHLSGFAPGLVQGKMVRKGEVIGYVGNTGRSTGPHLHYEVRIDGKAIDPLLLDTQDKTADALYNAVRRPVPPLPSVDWEWDWLHPFSSIWNNIKALGTWLLDFLGWLGEILWVAIENSFYKIIIWLYRWLLYIRCYCASVAMGVMLMFFPLIFLAMFFDRYKGAFADWLVTYLHLALWQPIGTVVMYVTTVSILGLAQGGMDSSTMVLIFLVAGLLAVSAVGEYARYAMVPFSTAADLSSRAGGIALTAIAAAAQYTKSLNKMLLWNPLKHQAVGVIRRATSFKRYKGALSGFNDRYTDELVPEIDRMRKEYEHLYKQFESRMNSGASSTVLCKNFMGLAERAFMIRFYENRGKDYMKNISKYRNILTNNDAGKILRKDLRALGKSFLMLNATLPFKTVKSIVDASFSPTEMTSIVNMASGGVTGAVRYSLKGTKLTIKMTKGAVKEIKNVSRFVSDAAKNNI